MYVMQLTKIGEALGLPFPDDLLTRLKVREGDELYLIETTEGMFLTVRGSEIEAQLAAARAIMGDRRHALRELAKSDDA